MVAGWWQLQNAERPNIVFVCVFIPCIDDVPEKTTALRRAEEESAVMTASGSAANGVGKGLRWVDVFEPV